jgi:hypothetical protein
MNSRLIRPRVSLLCLALALAACSSSSPEKKVDENLMPADYRTTVINTVMVNKSFDPTNIREASIAEPALKPVAGGTPRYVVCLRFNPRDLTRRYLGLGEYVAYFYAGDITQFVKVTDNVCAGAAYKPFPELEKLCLGDKCT